MSEPEAQYILDALSSEENVRALLTWLFEQGVLELTNGSEWRDYLAVHPDIAAVIL